MFSGNEKISSRQVFRNGAAGLISLGALAVPLVMDREGLSEVLAALILLGILLTGAAFAPRPENVWSKVLCYLHFWVLGTMVARLAGLLIQDFLLAGTALWPILLGFYLICYYDLYKGLECRARVSEILFGFFLLLILLLSILALPEAELSRCRELRLAFDMEKAGTGYRLFCFLTVALSLWHLRGKLGSGPPFQKTVWAMWGIGAAAALFFGIFTYCIYGDKGHTGLVFPLASAMTLAHFPGDVIGRLDALFVFAWAIGLFLLCGTLFAPLIDGEPDQKQKWLLAALLAASFALALQPECMEWGQNFLYMVSTPIQVLLVLLNLLGGKSGRKLLACLALIPALLLSGCSAQELEDQSIVTSVSVDMGTERAYHLSFGFGTSEEEGREPAQLEADSLAEAKELYWESDQKHLNFNHLKNFYLSRTILTNEKLKNFLEEIQLDGTYSRGTAVYVTLGEASEEARREEQPDGGIPIHRLLNAWYNQEECCLPAITEEGEYKGSVSWRYSD